jgi:hypothetical protein
MQVECKVLVKDEIAASFPSRPDRVRECMVEAEQVMTVTAKERGRHLSEPPRFTDARPTGLGLVEITFTAATETG